MIKPVAVLALMALAACASVDPKPFSGPDGRQAYSMKCSGFGLDWDQCLQKAGELCPQGYDIISQQSDIVAVPAGNSILAAPRQSMAILCRG